MEKRKKIKLLMVLVPILLVVSALSGCVAANAIQTKHWDHINTEGTGVRLWGFLVLAENFHNWDGYFVYDTEKHDNWELYEYRVEADNYDSLNFFSVDIYDLDRTTEYHYRAVGEKTDQSATIRVGVDHTFIPGGPRVAVDYATNIEIDSVTLNGVLTHMGGAATCEVFFRYGTDPNNLNLETTHETMTSTGDFSADISGLSSCVTYYFKAIAINDADTWSSVFTFQVTPGLPTVQTFLPNEVTETSAKFRGELFDFGGPATCTVWFEYGDDNPNQLDEETDPIVLSELGDFDIVQDGLTPGTTYWVRAVADNGVCENRGKVKEFRTAGGLEQENEQIESLRSTIKEHRLQIVNRILEKLKARYPELEGLSIDSPIIQRFLK
jgi:hypothetical protein